MRVYLAGPYGAREKLRTYRDALVEQDVECTSSWLDEPHEINSQTTGSATGLTDDEVDGHARMDLADVERSDVFVLLTGAALNLTLAQAGSGGRHVETGYALARGKRVLVVGAPENVFHRLASAGQFRVERYADWRETLHRLIALRHLEEQISREKAEDRAREEAAAHRVIGLDRYPGEPTGPDAA